MTRRERMEQRLEKRLRWADAAKAKSEAGFQKARVVADGIPLGQPILVGHHSERRHRRDIARIDSGMRQGCERAAMASHHESKAGGIEAQLERTIYSDDPGAVEALEAKATALEQAATRYAEINRAFRREHKKGDGWLERMGLSDEEKAAFLNAAKGHALCYGDRCAFKGFPSYKMSNMRSNARTARERIKSIRAMDARQAEAEAAPAGMVIRRHTDANWCSVTFATKPERAILEALKAAHYGWGRGSWSGYLDRLPACVAELESSQVMDWKEPDLGSVDFHADGSPA